MITDKDREDAKIICSAIKIPIELSVGGLKIVTTVSTGEILAKLNSETIEQILYGIRSESAEQARKDAAERAVAFLKKEWYWFNDDTCYADEVREAILGDSVTVSSDSEKLAIAVKALEEIREMRWGDSWKVAHEALKEIHG